MEMDKKSSRALLLALTTFTYLLLGAAVFDRLETSEDGKLREEIAHIRRRMQLKYTFTERDNALLETMVLKGIPHKAGPQWQFAGAFYFATVVITTVGYGHAAPETTGGRLFCMIFAIAGIPMGLIMFQSIGERVNTGIAYCLHKIRATLHHHGLPYLQEITPTHLLGVSLSIGTAIILMGTWVFHQQERWSLFEAYYYCFVTLSTIGFGDYVPLQRGNAIKEKPWYYIFTLLFILVGLAVFSACVNLLVLGFMAPNADEVTAASQQPQAAVVIEKFAPPPMRSRANSLVDCQIYGLQRGSRDATMMSMPPRRKRTTSTCNEVNFSCSTNSLHKKESTERLTKCLSFCTSCCKPKLVAVPYTVKQSNRHPQQLLSTEL